MSVVVFNHSLPHFLRQGLIVFGALASKPQGSSGLCLLGPGITGVCYCIWLLKGILVT